MQDLGGALDCSNNPGAHLGVHHESLVHAGSHENGRHDLVAEVLLADQAPLVEGSPLGNPESPLGRARSRDRVGNSPRSRVRAVAAADVANQPHEEGRPARDGHKCLAANDRPLDRGRRCGLVQLDD